MSDIRNHEVYRARVLDELGEDYTVEDLRNFERWRLKVLHGLGNSHVSEADLLKTFIHKTASGDIATITDGADDVPCKSVKVSIVPKQSGSGDPSPSNVRPISGWDEVEVVRTGTNIWDEEWEVGLLNPDGSVTPNSQRLTTKNYIPIKEGVEFCMSAPSIARKGRGAYYDGNHNLVQYASDFPESVTIVGNRQYGMFTPPSGAKYLKVCFTLDYGNTYNNDISINYPSTDHDYHAYQGTSYPIPLPSTVYGGTLDVVSGVLNLTYGMVDLGSLTWAYNSSTTLFRANITDGIRTENSHINGWCSRYKMVVGYNPSGGINDQSQNNAISVGSSYEGSVSNVLVRDTTYTDATAFKTAVNGTTLVYKLANPTTVQLTPTQVNTLLGSNNIWADTGDVEVEYRADSTLAYNELAATVLENVGN